MYEKRIFSQHGEDGIIEYLANHQKECQKRFLEIGYGDGRQNNSLNLSRNHGWSGVGVDMRDQSVEPPGGVTVIQEMIDLKSVDELLAISGKNVDFYSIDIDSIDYWLTVALMDAGLNPAFVCVEIMNGAGDEVSVAPPLRPGFKYNKFHICGASIRAWQNFWTHRGYKFLTMDKSGINAFFYHPEKFECMTDYPVIEYVPSKKNKGYDDWLSIFNHRANIEECIVTGKETIKDINV